MIFFQLCLNMLIFRGVIYCQQTGERLCDYKLQLFVKPENECHGCFRTLQMTLLSPACFALVFSAQPGPVGALTCRTRGCVAPCGTVWHLVALCTAARWGTLWAVTPQRSLRDFWQDFLLTYNSLFNSTTDAFHVIPYSKEVIKQPAKASVLRLPTGGSNTVLYFLPTPALTITTHSLPSCPFLPGNGSPIPHRVKTP